MVAATMMPILDATVVPIPTAFARELQEGEPIDLSQPIVWGEEVGHCSAELQRWLRSNRGDSEDQRADCGRYSPEHTFQRAMYDDVVHNWNGKPFIESKIRSLFGVIREDRMERLVQERRKQLADDSVWDREGLVLVDLRRPYQSPLLFSVAEDACGRIDQRKLTYLSGTWFSKVFEGDYGSFSSWFEEAKQCMQGRFRETIDEDPEFYVFYPSALEKQKPAGHCVLVFFLKVAN